MRSGPGDARNPRNTDEPVVDLHDGGISGREAVEIEEVNGDALVAAAFAPRCDIEAPNGNGTRHGEFSDDPDGLGVDRRTVESAVDEKEPGEEPGRGDEGEINALGNFELGVAKGATLDIDDQAEREEKEDADKNQDSVELDRGVAKRGDDEGQSAEKKDGGAIEELDAERKLGGGRAETAGSTNVGVAFGAAIQAARHPHPFCNVTMLSSAGASVKLSGRGSTCPF